jgi:hypothetical protein
MLLVALAILLYGPTTVWAIGFAAVADGEAADAPPLPPEPVLSPGKLEPLEEQAELPWPAQCSECGDIGCASCTSPYGGAGGHLRLFGGVEYLEARPTFSQSLAFVRQVRATAPDPNGVLQNVDQDISYDFARTDTVRAFLGLRLRDCCSELRFTYWRLRSQDSLAGTAGTDTAGNDIFYNIWNVSAAVPGEQLLATSQVSGDVYDIEYKRCVRGTSVCDATGACCLPWNLHWSAGVRIAEWDYENEVVSTAASPTRADVSMEYDGAGPLIGLEGRRNLRVLRCAHAYASFHTALLLGQMDNQLVRTSVVGPNTSREVFVAGENRIVPVTELELGVAWQFGCFLNLSGGWFHQVWWDLGMSEDVVNSNINLVRDDANIMGWDGLAIRLEFSR